MVADPAARGTTPADNLATVVALGDLGRSPRMCLHASALASAGYLVEIFAYADTAIPGYLAADDRVRVNSLPTRPAPRSRGFAYLVAMVPTLLTRFVDLVRALAASQRSRVILVQNPPALPALPVLVPLAIWRGSCLVVDWHNFGWTILGVRLGQDSVIVTVAGWLERLLAGGASLHLCVSEGMRRRLSERYGVEATVFRDLPAREFAAAATEDRDSMRAEVLAEIDIPESIAARLGDGSAKLLISSTSWSADEDFSLLLDALRLWSTGGRGDALPHLIVVVSGLGPLRGDFEREAERADLHGVTVRTAWLSDTVYPRLMASADLGICLHRSSSGVDLPMKLADMHGAHLPTCALDYGPCLREVMREGDNGFLFETAENLAEIWTRLFVEQPETLRRMRAFLVDQTAATWQDHWIEIVEPMLPARR